ncbi:MAG: hypothetical protein M0022_06185 [Desulfobacteraceae bacterium]|nr:hypothetical protein [Desulfobacteraceae bacterium]
MKNDSDHIICSRIEISGAMIREIDGEKTVIAIPREQVRTIKLDYDTRVGNPFFQFCSGFILIMMGGIGLTVALLASPGGALPVIIEPDRVTLQLIPIILWLMFGIGIWCLLKIFGASYYLLIETESGAKKIFFEKSMELQDIKQFIRKVHWSFGYEIDTSILEKIESPS